MRKRIKALRAEEGFTPVELLVVITILGVLSAVAVIAVGGSSTDSKQAACKADVATVQAAAYLAKTNVEATSLNTLTTAVAPAKPYLRSAPTSGAYSIQLVSGVATPFNKATPAVATTCDAVS